MSDIANAIDALKWDLRIDTFLIVSALYITAWRMK